MPLPPPVLLLHQLCPIILAKCIPQLHCRAKHHQEQTSRAVSGDRALEQARRAAAVNVEIIRANGALKQQLRVSKTQVM